MSTVQNLLLSLKILSQKVIYVNDIQMYTWTNMHANIQNEVFMSLHYDIQPATNDCYQFILIVFLGKNNHVLICEINSFLIICCLTLS